MNYEARAVRPTEGDILAGYAQLRTGVYDELMNGDGQVRPHWRKFISALSELAPTEQNLRADRLKRRVRETGIAYDIFADPNSSVQRWQVDLVPLVFSSAEWRQLEQGVIQRARLFNALLADIYSEQRLMQSGQIPPSLVFADSAYLSACNGIRPPSGHLQFFATDLARDADGRWRIIDSHTETPAGAGFALANRVVHTHVAGDIFKECNAIRIASFFQRAQANLTSMSGRAGPRIALLTPGPHHEDYFSHAYLARYLGYLLVEGSDLRTVRGRVFLKTLEGLKRIDLVVRCADGQCADPLELNPAEFDGPVGLVQACRKSPGLVVNALGSAVVQNRALGRYLEPLCRDVLGEPLLLKDAERWWLGDPASRQHVLDNFETMVVRKVQEGTGRPGRAEFGSVPAEMTAEDREILLREIGLYGDSLVAEEKAGFGTTPTFTPVGLVPQPFALRVFVAATEQGFAVMPGGLAMTIDPNHAVALSAPEGRTRDVWVLSDDELAPHVSLWRPTVETARVQRSQRVIQSRVADDLFWLGRYGERADWTLRILRSALQRLQEDSGPADGQHAARRCLEVLIANDKGLRLAVGEQSDAAAIEQLSHLLVSGKGGKRTLERTLDHLYRVASLTRDRLSLDAWRVLSRFRKGDEWRTGIVAAAPGTALDYFEDGLAAIAAFNGLMHENMTRNFGWSFLDMGRRLERAYNLCEATLSLFGRPADTEEEVSSLLFLLELADSFITYRSRYRLDPMLPLVLDLLLLDETNPRSIAYQYNAISQHLESLPQAKQGASLPEERRLTLGLLTSIRLADVERLALEPSRAALESMLREQRNTLPVLSTAIERRYFNLTEDQPHRVHTRQESLP